MKRSKEEEEAGGGIALMEGREEEVCSDGGLSGRNRADTHGSSLEI